MENKTYEINVYDYLLSELTNANEQLDSIWGCDLLCEERDSLNMAQFAITKCIDIIIELRKD